MNRYYDVQQSLQQENYALLAQQFQRMQTQNYHQNSPSPTPSYERSPVANNSGEPRPLPNLVEPGKFDVICARGSAAANHIGNLRFREIIRQKLPQYNNSKTKLEKSLIVTSIVDAVRDYTPNGGFVKQDSNGQWYDVGDALAREKIGQCIRDQLHSKYKSSTKAKKQRRKELEKQKKKAELGSKNGLRLSGTPMVLQTKEPVQPTTTRFEPHLELTSNSDTGSLRFDQQQQRRSSSNKIDAYRARQLQQQQHESVAFQQLTPPPQPKDEEDPVSLMMFAPIGESFASPMRESPSAA